MEKNNDKYIDEFPININPIEFKYTNTETITKWLKSNNFNEQKTAEEVLDYYIKKYNLEEYSKEDARKIIAIRY